MSQARHVSHDHAHAHVDGHAGHDHSSHGSGRRHAVEPRDGAASLLRASALERLGFAAIGIAAVWAGAFWAMS